MGLGKFLEKNFKGKQVELMVNRDFEWLQYAEYTVINSLVIFGTFVSYDEESEVITMLSRDKQEFYLDEKFILSIWQPGFNILRNCKDMINSNNRLLGG